MTSIKRNKLIRDKDVGHEKRWDAMEGGKDKRKDKVWVKVGWRKIKDD